MSQRILQTGETKTITFTVPADAQLGESKMRIICDGGVNNKYNPTADNVLCKGTYQPNYTVISYAGSVNDIPVVVSEKVVEPEPESTALKSAVAEISNGEIYDLNGKRVSENDLQNGQIYIKNGEKFSVVK